INNFLLLFSKRLLKKRNNIFKNLRVNDGLPFMVKGIGPKTRNKGRTESVRSFIYVDVGFKFLNEEIIRSFELSGNIILDFFTLNDRIDRKDVLGDIVFIGTVIDKPERVPDFV